MSEASAAGGSAPERPTGSHWRAWIGGVDVLFGAGVLQLLGEEARRLGVRRALVVSDPGVVAAGHAERALWALASAEVQSTLFARVPENPTTRAVAEGAAEAATFGAELIVAVGGGSTLDAAKGINFLVTNGGKMSDYWGFGRAAKPLLPSIGIPTTAGTGSEAQSYALITQSEPAVAGDRHGRKMACGDPKARFRLVLLDPELATTAPLPVRALAGLDALSHAVESYVTKRSNPVSKLLARAGWEALSTNFPRALEPDVSLETTGSLLLGAHLAGAAIEASMLGAAHAAANPLTARFGVVHGLAVGLMLPAVVRFNAEGNPEAARAYQDLASDGAALAAQLEGLRAAAGLPGRLRELDIPHGELPELARRATQEWTGGFNPRPVAEQDFLELYERTY